MGRKPAVTLVTLSLSLAVLLVGSVALPAWSAPIRLTPAQGAGIRQVNSKMDVASSPTLSSLTNQEMATSMPPAQPPPRIRFGGMLPYDVDEGAGVAVITVTLSRVVQYSVTVDYATSDGTATAGQDYTAVSGTLIFITGTTATSFTVPILDDTIEEPNETVTLTLSNPHNGVIRGPNPVSLVILDDEPPVVQFTSSEYSVGEGFGVALITVALGNPHILPVTVDYATYGGTATAGADYVTATGTLTFSPGMTQQTFNVPIIDDALDEPVETVLLTLTNPSSATIGPTNPATLFIVDNDGMPTVDFAFPTYSVWEPAGNAVILVILSNPYTSTVTVDYTTIDGTATAGADYTTTNGTLVFTPGLILQTFTVPIIDDTLYEGDETVILSLTNASSATIGLINPATLLILDDDQPPAPLVQFSAAAYTAGEASGSALITVALSYPYSQTVTVDYTTIDGTATAGADYTTANGTLVFTPGLTLRTFTVPIIDDILDEADETVILSLTNASNATIGPINPATLFIQDNDGVPTVYFSAASYTVDEDGGQAVISVTLSNPYSLTATVDYTTADGTATAGADYVAASGTLTFTPGTVWTTFTVTILDDALVEPDETILLTLSNPINASLGMPSAAVLTILDQDITLYKVYLPIVLKNQ